MAKKDSTHYITLSNSFIYSESTREAYRVSKEDFTRNRKMPFELLVLCMLQLLRKSLASELHHFFNQLNISFRKVTASAFVQSRKKLKPDLFYDLNHLISNDYYKDNDETVELFKGLRLLSIDGSTLNLPLTGSIIAEFGTCNNQKKTDDVVIARTSVLYDVLNEIVLDGLLKPFSEGEVSLSRAHFDHLKEGDLVIMDRAYTSFESAYILLQKKVHFLFRCKTTFSNQIKAFYESGEQESIIKLKAKQNKSFKNLPYTQDTEITVRALRIELGTGEVEILITSLLDNTLYPYEVFKDLYFERWKIETFYDRLKNIINIENFSGTSPQFILQEFNCALYMSNMQTILIEDAESEVKEIYADRKYEYKVNKSVSWGFIRERLLELYSQKQETAKIMLELKKLFMEHVIPIRPGRSNIREVDKYRQRTKPKQFKNRRLVL